MNSNRLFSDFNKELDVYKFNFFENNIKVILVITIIVCQINQLSINQLSINFKLLIL